MTSWIERNGGEPHARCNSFRAATSGVIAKFPDLFPPDLVALARSAAA